MSDDLTTAYLIGAEHMREQLHKQADMNGRLLTENAELRQRITELEAALNKWQKWWEMPWQDRRPDMADLCHMKARKVLDGAK